MSIFLMCFRRIRVKEPRQSEITSDEKCYLYRSMRGLGLSFVLSMRKPGHFVHLFLAPNPQVYSQEMAKYLLLFTVAFWLISRGGQFRFLSLPSFKRE